MTQVLEGIVFAICACGFAGKATGYAFDFYHTPITDFEDLQRQAAGCLVTLAGMIASLTLFYLSHKL